jgi:tetratricopeptide (TPR) repeat protein
LLGAHRGTASAECQLAVWRLLAARLTETRDRALAAFAVATLALRLLQLDTALEALQRDRSVADTPPTLAGLAITLAAMKRWQELVEVLVSLAATTDDKAAVFLLREAACCAARLGDGARAVAIIRLALDRTRNNRELLEEAAALFLRAGHHDESARVLEQAARLASGAEAAELFCTRGTVLLDRLADPAGAEEALRRALKIQPLHVRSLHALYRLLVASQRYRDLPPILLGLLYLTKTEDGRLKLLLNLASLHRNLWETEGSAADAEECIRYCDQVLALDGASEGAIKNLVLVCEKLRRWPEIVGRLGAAPPSASALRGLSRAYQEMGQLSEQAVALERLAELATSPQERIAALLSAGEVYRTQLANPKAAERCSKAALAIDPECAEERPPEPGAAQRPPEPGAAQRPPEPGAAQRPPELGAEERPPELGAGERSSAPEMEDQIDLANSLQGQRDHARAIAILREAIRRDAHYIPVYDHLQRIAAAAGENALAGRAGQVAAVARGQAGAQPPAVITGPLPSSFWERTFAELARHPLSMLWELLLHSIDAMFPADQPPAVILALPELQLASAQMAALFGVKLDILKLRRPKPVTLVFGSRLLTGLELEALHAREVRVLLALHLTAVRSGHGGLLKHAVEQRLEIARQLASMLADGPSRPDALDRLPRREQRTVASFAQKHPVSLERVDETARSWLSAIESLSIKVALLVTDDLVSVASILGRHAGLSAEDLTKEGLFHAVPHLHAAREVFLSDEFHRARAALEE